MRLNFEESMVAWQQIYDLSVSMLGDSDLMQAGGPSYRNMANMRTIHMGGGRQNGKSSWIMKMMRENPQALLVEKDAAQRNDTIKRLRELKIEDPIRRVYTVRDIVTMMERKDELMEQRLADATHLFINDASFNYMATSIHFTNALDGAMNAQMLIVKVG